MGSLFFFFFQGNLCFQENLRRLVPCDVWNIMSSYFPLAKAFPKEVEPCFKCEVSLFTAFMFPNQERKSVYIL